eukprot:scpid88867/ scgid25414/ 
MRTGGGSYPSSEPECSTLPKTHRSTERQCTSCLVAETGRGKALARRAGRVVSAFLSIEKGGVRLLAAREAPNPPPLVVSNRFGDLPCEEPDLAVENDGDGDTESPAAPGWTFQRPCQHTSVV